MDNNMIDGLRNALNQSPDNVPLRMMLANSLLHAKRWDEAEAEFQHVNRLQPSVEARMGLAQVFFQKGSFSACNVVLEELIDEDRATVEVWLLHARALLREQSFTRALESYQKALLLKPDLRDDELDAQLRVANQSSGAEESLDTRFLEKPDIGFRDVGGMDAVKKEIELKIIKPLMHPEVYKAYGKKIGGGILLYGPPGCGKTFIAKATAGEVKARFINVGLNDILDMWIGNSEKNLHELFELARNNTPCVVFIDEIDALGASRSDMRQSAGRHLINQFLQELDGIANQNDGLLIIGATNAPWSLDPAFRRPGRFDRIIFVPPPDLASRESILRLKLANKPVQNIDFHAIARKTEHFSGADLDAIIDLAIEAKLDAAFINGRPAPLTSDDIQQAVKRHKASTQEWFQTARNYAMFANDSGLYDEILTYLKIKK